MIQEMEIVQKKKHCGLPAPAGIYKIKGENKITGRQKDYFITDLANLSIPADAPDDLYTSMTELEVDDVDLNNICSPNFIQGYNNGNRPQDYIVILAMSEDIHVDITMLKIALLNSNSGKIELFTSTNTGNEELTGKGQTVECFNPLWRVWKKASLDADVYFWRRLRECCQQMTIYNIYKITPTKKKNEKSIGLLPN